MMLAPALTKPGTPDVFDPAAHRRVPLLSDIRQRRRRGR